MTHMLTQDAAMKTAMKPTRFSDSVLARAAGAIRARPISGRRAGSDYGHVRRILAYITENWREQPTIETIAKQPARRRPMSPSLPALVRAHPQGFLQAITLDHARAARLLGQRTGYPLEVGLSGPGRLHDSRDHERCRRAMEDRGRACVSLTLPCFTLRRGARGHHRSRLAGLVGSPTASMAASHRRPASAGRHDAALAHADYATTLC